MYVGSLQSRSKKNQNKQISINNHSKMAEISDHLKLNTYSDKTYISKRSIRKTLVRKRRYEPAESEATTDCRRGGFTLNGVEGTLSCAGCVSAMVDLKPATPDGWSFSESLAKCSYVEKGGPYKSEDVSQKAGSDQNVKVLVDHMAEQDPSNSTNHMAELHASVSANHMAELTPSTPTNHPKQQDPSVSASHIAEQDLCASDNHTTETEEVPCFATGRVKLEDVSSKSCDLVLAPASQQEHGPNSQEKRDWPDWPPSAFSAPRKRRVEEDARTRPYKCTLCIWAFKKPSNLLSHMDTHSGLKPHLCDLCGKAYAHLGTLQQHRRLHTGEKPYRCELCGKAYTWSSDYRKHIRTHTGERPYACAECGKEFARSSDLRKHERNLHTDDEPFNRPRTHLAEQMSVDAGLRPYRCAVTAVPSHHQRAPACVQLSTCRVCGESFSHYSALQRHLLQQQCNGRIFVCPQCSKSFPCDSQLAKHMLSHKTSAI